MKASVRLPVALWLGFLLVCAFLAARAQYSADLAAFLPRSPTPAQQILVDELRDGMVSKLILIGIEGTDEPRLAALSQALVRRLDGDAHFSYVGNGTQDRLEADGEFLLRHRYLLSSAVAPERFTAAGLRRSLERQLDLLNSPAGMLTGALLANDPTGEFLRLLDALREQGGPHQRGGVWFAADGRRTLLIAQTRAAGFDLDAQTQAQAQIRAAFDAVAREQAIPPARLLMSGPGVFAVASRAGIQRDALRFSLLASVLVSAVLLLAYRSPGVLMLTLVPVASGALAGIAAVALGFGSVHGVTLGFGATLIGEAVDYAIYLFTNTGSGDTSAKTLQRIWPTLKLGVLTSVCGFGAMLFSGFPGLAQLGLFSSAGLVTAVAVTRWVLPELAPAGYSVRAVEALGPALAALVDRARVLRLPLVLVVFVLAIGVVMQGGAAWNDELSGLSPISSADQRLDEQLRRDLGAPDVRQLIVVRAASEQTALETAERIGAALAPLKAAGVLSGFDSPALYLPSAATQRSRQQAIPEARALTRELAAATQGLPFRSGVFAPFVAAAEAAKQMAPLSRNDLRTTALALKLDALLTQRHGEWFALMPLRGVTDAVALERAVARAGGAQALLLDLKREADALYRDYRARASAFAALGAAAIVVLLLFALRSPARTWDVLAPLAAAVVVTVAFLLATGARLNIFHLVALLLVVGVGSNYSLFFERGNPAGAHPQRILTSVLLCNLSTVIGFGVLGFASTPVLSAIGTTVAIGAFLSLMFAAILSVRRPS